VVTYVLRRLGMSVLVMVAVLVLVFIATRLIGDPVNLMLPADSTEIQRATLREHYGLDEPVLVQFWDFMTGAVRGDFGDSLYQGVPALGVAWSHMPATLLLTSATLLWVVPFALLFGAIAARRRGSPADRAVGGVSLVALATVDFVLAILLILVFAVNLGWFPTSGYGGLAFLVLPALALGARPFGRITQVTRATVGEELDKPYVLTARAKGVGERRRLGSHVLRNAAIPVIALTGAETVGLINGAIIVETIFGWPGVGNLLIEAIQTRDLPMIEAVVFVTAIFVLAVNLLVDLSYAWFNPRLRT